MRILVVEDERRMASFISQALAEESCAVDWAGDGQAGLEMATTYDYDAIVLDLMLPKLDGLAVCRALRSAGRRAPVLMVSARDMVADRVKGLDAGADDYLVKPFAIEELLARLRALERPRDAEGRRPVPRAVHAHGPPRRTRDSAYRQRICGARVPDAAQRHDRHADDDRGARLELHVRGRKQHRRRVRRPPAGQDRRAGHTDLHPVDSGRRVCSPRSCRG
jgi:DNA-binding response OmpR family regulator